MITINIIYWQPTTVYYVSSDGSSTFSIFDGSFTFVIDNNIELPTKTITVYGFDTTSSLTISASNLIENVTSEHISSGNVLFNNKSTYLIDNANLTNPVMVDLSIGNNENPTGLYQGSLFIVGKDEASIPIILDIKPTFNRVIIWVINGIATAVAFWKIIKYYNERYEKSDNQTYRTLGFQAFLKDRKITWGTIGKNVILDAGSIMFGVVVSLLGLLDNTYITGLRILDVYSILVLIGIGLGIGSLKEYIHQASEPENPKGEMNIA